MVYTILRDKLCLTCRKYLEIQAERKREREEGKVEREREREREWERGIIPTT